MADLEYLKQVVVSMDADLQRTPVFRWATVTATDPLALQMDGDVGSIIGGFSSTIPKQSLRVGDRVQVLLQNARMTIQGVGGGGAGFQFMGTEVFSTVGSASFVKADYDGLRAVRVKLVGAGGSGGDGGGAGGGAHSSGGGGGGGGYAESFIRVQDLPASLNVTVGRGGRDISGFNGEDGQPSSFGSLVAASGGKGGAYFAASALMIGAVGGHGGVGTAGQIRIAGSAGEMGSGHATLGHGGNGGSSQLGGGGAGNYTGAGSGSTDGQAGGQYGGGGAGGTSNAGGPKGAGGNGAHGVVIVELYC